MLSYPMSKRLKITDEILHHGRILSVNDFRKQYSGYADKTGQVSSAVGNPYLKGN